MERSDETLIREIGSGSELAFEHIMERYQRLVYRVSYCYVRDKDSALDVTQNVFLKVHRKVHTLRDAAQFKTWLLRIAHRESLNWLRDQRLSDRESLSEDSLLDSGSNQEESLLIFEYRELLLESLSSLNPKQRLAVILRYFERMPIRDISTTLNCSQGVVKNILFRSLRKLRAYLVSRGRNEHDGVQPISSHHRELSG